MRIKRAMALAAVSALAGAGLVVGFAAPASAVTTTNNPSGNDQTLIQVTTTDGCAAGTLTASYALEGPGSDFVTNGEGFVSTAPLVGGGVSQNFSLANIRTGTATFGTGPFPQVYGFNVICEAVSGTTVITLGNLTVLAIGNTGVTYNFAGVVQSVATTTAVVASPDPANEGGNVTLTANVTPASGSAADIDAGTVTFTVTGPGGPFTITSGTVTNGVATGTFVAPLIPGSGNPNTNYSVTGIYNGVSPYSTSPASAADTFQVQDAAPAVATTTTLGVTVAGTPIVSGGTAASGAPSSPVVLTATVAPAAAGTVAFFNGAQSLGTSPVTAGVATYTNNSGFAGAVSFTAVFTPADPVAFVGSTSGAFTYTFSGVNVCSLTTGTSPLYTDTAGAFTPFTGSQCVDPQTFQVEVPAGNLIISTPYTPANPFNLGVLQLSGNGSSWSSSAPFGSVANPAQGVSITDTRPGNQPFTAAASSLPFTSAGGGTIAANLLSFDAPTARYVTGNRLDGLTVPTTVTTTPITAFSASAQTFATGTGPGSVFVTGTITLDNVPTSVPAGLYQTTVTFTIA